MDISGAGIFIDFPTQVQMDLFDFEQKPTMGEYIMSGKSGTHQFETREELMRILTAIRLGAKLISREISKGALSKLVGAGVSGKINVQGELQHSLDFCANQILVNCLRSRNIVCGMVSEEEENIIELSSAGGVENNYIVLIDPLDGSSNIDVNIPVGTIFSVLKRKTPPRSPVQVEDFLQPGSALIAAGYALYGSSTMLVFSTGHGVHGFTLDNSIGTLYLTHPNMRFPEIDKTQGIYSVNEGNIESFPKGVKEYISRCQQRKQSGRYVGSLVADFHRNLLKGGIYMYPPTCKDFTGKLRLLYEANPIAFLAEAAGGKASTGFGRILQVVPTEIHQRCPLFVGSKCMVEELEEFLKVEGLIVAGRE